jgi:hypothetical protein
MINTLVIILNETRAHELTFDNFKKNVIDELNADLCLCIGVKHDYDYNNNFYQIAKYKFLYDEPNDFGDALEYAYNILSQNKPEYEILEDINILDGQNPTKSNENNNREINIYKNAFILSNIYKKPIYWREFLKIKDQFMGGVLDKENGHPGSAGILLFFRWFLLKNLIDNDLLNKYERFIITRSDFIYQLPHPKIEHMNKDYIWIPDFENYGGYTARHVILSNTNIEIYLNIFNSMVLKSNHYFMKMKNKNIDNWNIEKLIKFHFEENNIIHLIKKFPYIMYAVRNKDGKTRWSSGNYNESFGYYIKYTSEYNKSTFYKNQFENSQLSIDNFYKKYFYNSNLQKYIISNIDSNCPKGYAGLKYHLEEAYIENNLPLHNLSNDPPFAIFSKKYYNEIDNLDNSKIHDFCFIGSINSCYEKRIWVIDFAKKNFTSNSIFINTDPDWKLIGDFDYSDKNLGYNPKIQKDNQSKGVQYRVVSENLFYFSVMCKSKFILCPEGDAPWSFRFYETLMCKSIPIVESVRHTYRTDEESNIDYQYMLLRENKYTDLLNNNLEYSSLVEKNTILFKIFHMLE